MFHDFLKKKKKKKKAFFKNLWWWKLEFSKFGESYRNMTSLVIFIWQIKEQLLVFLKIQFLHH